MTQTLPSREVLVFAEHGADYRSLHETLRQTYTPYPNVKIIAVTKDDLMARERLDPERIIAFFLPGGSRANYDQTLNTDGFSKIRQYIEEGGCFIGICAGAYYACSQIKWQKHEESAVEKTPSMRLFHGTAAGPIIPLTQRNKGRGNWYDAQITPVTYYRKQKAFGAHSLYWGGPQFIPDPRRRNGFEIMARFDDLEHRPACLINSRLHRGMVILSSIHPEVTAYQIARHVTGNYHSVEFGRALQQKLQAHDISRQKLWLSLINEITEHRINLSARKMALMMEQRAFGFF